MKSLLAMIVLALSACATAPPSHRPAGMSELSGSAGAIAITADELRRTGRTELSDAMRAASPIFR